MVLWIQEKKYKGSCLTPSWSAHGHCFALAHHSGAPSFFLRNSCGKFLATRMMLMAAFIVPIPQGSTTITVGAGSNPEDTDCLSIFGCIAPHGLQATAAEFGRPKFVRHPNSRSLFHLTQKRGRCDGSASTGVGCQTGTFKCHNCLRLLRVTWWHTCAALQTPKLTGFSCTYELSAVYAIFYLDTTCPNSQLHCLIVCIDAAALLWRVLVQTIHWPATVVSLLAVCSSSPFLSSCSSARTSTTTLHPIINKLCGSHFYVCGCYRTQKRSAHAPTPT